ncbi:MULTISPECIES: hypothetical protein [Paenibacillus]|uniref:hypothetical protein n=1 Tax=Paenibacillus TaxID=44249 RepID=UPI002FDFB7A4
MAKGITLQELDSLATSRLVVKDSMGRAQVAAPATGNDIALKSTVDDAVGPLSGLLTTDKSNAVAAINELFTNVSDGKNAVASAITDKGVPASGSETLKQLSEKIWKIPTGKRLATGTLRSADYIATGQTLSGTRVVVNSLDFRPSLVFVWTRVFFHNRSGDGITTLILYVPDVISPSNYADKNGSVSFGFNMVLNSNGFTLSLYRKDTEGSFHADGTSNNVTWWAIE